MSFTTRERPTPSRSPSTGSSTGLRSGSGSACCSTPGARTCCESRGSSTPGRLDPSSSTACNTSSTRRSTSVSGPTRITDPGSSSSPEASIPKSCWTPCLPSADCLERGPCPSTPSTPYRSRNPLTDLAKRVMRPLAAPVGWCWASIKVAQRSPVSRDGRPWRRHRHLGRPAGDQRGKDHAEGRSIPIADAAREEESASATDALRSGCDARIGWLEAETVATLDRTRALLKPDRQVQEFSGSESLPEASPGVRGQRRGYKEASSLEVEDRVHAQDLLASTRRVVYAPADHSSYDVRTALCTGRRR